MMDRIQIHYPQFTHGEYNCLEWNVTQRFMHTEQPQIRIGLEMNPKACTSAHGQLDQSRVDFVAKNSWLLCLTIVLALISMVIEIQYIIETTKVINRLKEQFERVDSKDNEYKVEDKREAHIEHLKRLKEANQQDTSNPRLGSIASHASLYNKLDNHAKFEGDEFLDQNTIAKRERLLKEANWNDLMFWDKMRLFDSWAIISIIANLAQIIGCTYSIFRNYLDIVTADTMLGLGCMLAWWTMLRYFFKTQAYKSMLASFIKSAPYVSRALISMIPLFIGYAFLGMAIFWESRRFSDFGVSCYTLFALMYGDMIWDTYNDLIQIDNMLA